MQDTKKTFEEKGVDRINVIIAMDEDCQCITSRVMRELRTRPKVPKEEKKITSRSHWDCHPTSTVVAGKKLVGNFVGPQLTQSKQKLSSFFKQQVINVLCIIQGWRNFQSFREDTAS